MKSASFQCHVYQITDPDRVVEVMQWALASDLDLCITRQLVYIVSQQARADLLSRFGTIVTYVKSQPVACYSANDRRLVRGSDLYIYAAGSCINSTCV